VSYLRSEAVLTHGLQNELLLYDPGQDSVHTLNATSRFVWDRCDGEHTVADITAEISAHYAVSLEEARRDVDGILEQMQILGLIRKSEPA